MGKTYYVYTLQCGDGTYYTGYTDHLSRRIAAHQSGKAAKYTRGRQPLSLVRVQAYPTKSEAMRAEYAFKRLQRGQKQQRIEADGICAEVDGDVAAAQLCTEARDGDALSGADTDRQS